MPHWCRTASPTSSDRVAIYVTTLPYKGSLRNLLSSASIELQASWRTRPTRLSTTIYDDVCSRARLAPDSTGGVVVRVVALDDYQRGAPVVPIETQLLMHALVRWTVWKRPWCRSLSMSYLFQGCTKMLIRRPRRILRSGYSSVRLQCMLPSWCGSTESCMCHVLHAQRYG